MKQLMLILSALAVTAVGSTAVSAAEIKKKKQFIEQVAARKLVMGHSWVKISPLGTVTGKGPKGGKITGSWEWDKKYYCRNIVIGGVPLPEDCQEVFVSGNVVTFTHEKGKGVPVSWVIE